MKKVLSLTITGLAMIFLSNCAVQETPTAGPACVFPAGSEIVSNLQSDTISACTDYTYAVLTASETATAESDCTTAGGTWQTASGCNSSSPHSCSGFAPVSGSGTLTMYFDDPDFVKSIVSYSAAQIFCENVLVGTWK